MYTIYYFGSTMTSNTNGKAFAPVIALNNRGVDFFTAYGDYETARKCFKAAIDILEKLLKDSRRFSRGRIAAAQSSRSENKVSLPTRSSHFNDATGSPLPGAPIMDHTTVGTHAERGPQERAEARNCESYADADGTVTRVRTVLETTPPSTNNIATPHADTSRIQAVVSPPRPPQEQVAQDTAPERKPSDTPLFVSKIPAMLEVGNVASDDISSSIATIVVSFNLALSYHMLSFTCDSAEKAFKYQRSALVFYEVAFAIRQKSEMRGRQGRSHRRAGGFMVPLLDLSILNNIGALYRQRGSTERAERFFMTLQSRLPHLDSTLVKHAGGFVRNLIAIGLENVSPPAAAA
jgi:tetratricopeptide (TPR) repeat protein